jgi:hypothetical protein
MLKISGGKIRDKVSFRVRESGEKRNLNRKKKQ